MRQLVDMHNRHNHPSQSCSTIGISFIIIRNDDDVRLQQVCYVVCSEYVCLLCTYIWVPRAFASAQRALPGASIYFAIILG